MKKLFSLIALAAAVFTACEPDNPEVSNDNLKIKLSSESIMSFGIDGGEGTITYDFEDMGDATRNKKKLPTPEAATAVEWITDITVHPTDLAVTFNVAANEGETREATIKVWSGNYSFMVMVRQDGNAIADQTFTANHLGGTYYGKLQSRGYNYRKHSDRKYTSVHGDRTTPVSASERAWRDLFKQICQATLDRMADPNYIAQDQVAFRNQTKYKTYYQYVWNLMRDEIEGK